VLNHFPIGPVSLALNGRVGRRVACVLDSRGTTMESFDLEEGEDVEEDVETIENASFS
jgi:anaphase-promoting complex subunit 4